jgi:trehalose-phosphatase
VHRYRLPAAAAIALATAVARAEEHGLDTHLEIKRTAVVLHTRGLPAPTARRLERIATRLWTPIAAANGVRLAPISGGVELRASARDKGAAVRALVRSHPGARVVVMVGDDRTDEDAFAALPRYGFGLRVGHAGHPTRAHGWLASPLEVREFLDAWRRTIRSSRGA